MNAKKAFSFIENMAIMTVLGIIIVLILPKLMNYQSRINKQLALRRAITTYQVVLTKELIGTSGLRTTDDADDYLKDDSYSGIVDRFDVFLIFLDTLDYHHMLYVVMHVLIVTIHNITRYYIKEALAVI